MQTGQFMQIAANIEAPTTYMALGSVLVVLVFLTLWREMATTNTSKFFPRSIGVLAFVASRVLVIIFTAALVDDHAPPPLLYVFLNLVCLYLAAGAIPDAIQASQGRTSNVELAPSDEDGNRDTRRSLNYQVAIFGLLGALVYIVVPRIGGDASLGSFLNMVFMAATIRVVIELFRLARSSRSELRYTLMALVVSFSASWMLVVAASAFKGSMALHMLQGARAADIFALVTGLFALQSTYVIQGFRHRAAANSIRKEAEKAKAELKLMNEVASDLYEDSSSMIQRQQERFRNLMGRVDSLEKILQIGISIQRTKDLKELLQMVSELIHDELGFRTVIMRLLNDRTQSFETKAYVGLNADAQDAVMNHRLPVTEYEQMIEPRFRISRSYFLKNLAPEDTPPPGPVPEMEITEGSALVSDHWSEIDRLIVPLYDDTDGGNTVGYISVEEPKNSDISMVDAIDNLESIATLAVTAIRNARYYEEVAEKNEKLRIYAEKLTNLNQMKSNFVATVSHEFRTPLTSIKAYCETLLKNADKVDRNILKEFLVVIDEESNRLMALIEDILDFSQMESGAIKFERAPCNLNEIVDLATTELSKNFERKEIHVHAVVPDTKVRVRAERELMKQLLVNLLHNASKFTPDKGDVWVRLEDETVSARIIVEDNGIGVPVDQIESIFDHFHQVDSGATREYGGTGMGLAICKNIVDWHDGKIWVENLPGRGARFVVVIPKKQVIVRNHVLNLEGTLRRFEVERYLEVLVEMVAELMNAKNASLMMLDHAVGELRIESALGMDHEVVEHGRVKLGEGISGRVAQENRSYLVEDIDRDTRVQMRNNDYIYDSRSFLSVPIAVEDHVLGVINVANPVLKETFEQSDCQLLEMFAGRMALALSKLSSFTDASGEFESVRVAFKSMLDARRYVDDNSTTNLTVVLKDVARRMGLTVDETTTLRYVFAVYDLGLAHVGYNIIKQPGQLTEAERKSVEQHTIIGTDMLKPIEMSATVRDAVLYHHENFDGSGYPGRLAGEEIPVLARIIRVADTFRALVSHRPYQKQYSVKEATDVLRQRSGSYFDPAIVRVFVESVKANAKLFEKKQRKGAAKKKAVVETVT